MAGTLAVYPGNQPTWRREGPFYNVKIDTAESGREVRTVWGDPPVARYRYTGEMILQASANEIAAVVALINDNLGEAGNFSMTDPVTKSSVTVRMDGPLSLSQYQGVDGWWKASIVCWSVIT